MDFIIGNAMVSSYKRLSYTAWYAFAEFVDNSTQAYFNNREAMDAVLESEGNKLTVDISYSPKHDQIVIRDNSFGMDEATLQDAMTLGLAPKVDDQRSKYGLGLKTAACWLGDEWSIKTSQLNEPLVHDVFVDVSAISSNQGMKPTKLHYETNPIEAEAHFTEITINNLNRQFQGRTLGKIKDYLRSMYRLDFENYGLVLRWQEEQLSWENLSERLYVLDDGTLAKTNIGFTINSGKKVEGWVGVLGKGYSGRKNAGFSVIKAGRVVEGWPQGFKPDKIFGDLDDGRNDLVNQRIVGELILDDFDVSHTKDAIVWMDNEYDEVDKELYKLSKGIIRLANELKYSDQGPKKRERMKAEVLDFIESEISSIQLQSFLESIEPPGEDLIQSAWMRFGNESSEGRDPDLDILVGEGEKKIHVLVFLIENSPHDPYVAIETSNEKNQVIITISTSHPYFQEMDHKDTLQHFIRDCVYDGVAEWKAVDITGSLQPYTIKFLKDGMLRIPFEIRKSNLKS